MNKTEKFFDVKGLNVKPFSNRTSILIISLVSLLLYANTFTHDFAFDDVAVITENKFVQEGVSGIPKILTTGSWDGFRPKRAMKIYRPFQLVVFAIQYEFFELNAKPYHIFHVFSYAALNCLIFLLLRVLLEKRYPFLPLLITLLFTIHPLHTDVVANIKGSADLFAMLFAVLAFLLLLLFLKRKKYTYIIFGSISFLISLSSKETAITYLAIFPLAMYYFTKLKVKTLFLNTIPYAIITIAYLGMRTLVFSGGNAMSMTINKYSNSILYSESLSQHIGTRLYGLGKNLQLMFFPHPLKTSYLHQDIPILEAYDFVALTTIFVYILLLVIGIRYFKKKSVIVFGIIYFLITISLFSNTIVMMPSIVSERWLLIPSLGFCIVAGALFYKSIVIQSNIKNFLYNNVACLLILIAVGSLFSFKTIDRNRDWKNDFTLFKADSKSAPNNHMNLRNYGTELMKLNDKDSIRKGIQYLKRATEIAPRRFGTNNNIAIAYIKLNELDNAIDAYKKEIELNPRNKVKVINRLWSAYNKKGVELMNTSKVAKVRQSINYFKNASDINGLDLASKLKSLHNLGKAHYLLTDLKTAINTYKAIYKAKPDKYDSVFTLGLIYNRDKQYQNALNILLSLQNIEGYKDTKKYKKEVYQAYKGLGQIELAAKYIGN